MDTSAPEPDHDHDQSNDRHAPNDLDDLGVLTTTWPAAHVLAVADERRILGATGDLDADYRIASITKLFTCYAVLVAVEEGTVDLDEPAGPPGSTVRHLMAHASGLGFAEIKQLAPAGDRRIYSNTGIDALASHLEARAGMAFADYLRMGVLEPLGLGHIDAQVSPAHGMRTSARSLVRFGRELLNPTLVHADTMAMATTPTFPALAGILPGFGSMKPNPWGLGFEIRGDKAPHWTAPKHSPLTFGHFGGSGSFLWIDPETRLIGASLGPEQFGPWAVAAWPIANAALLERYGQ